MSHVPRRVLAVSGSLRAKSVNTAVLLAAQRLAPPTLTIELHRGIGDLPHFNPDLDTPNPPAAVRHWRAALDAADILLLCTPEYAHGLPGALKNALDWLVGYEPFLQQPVAILNARPGAEHAQAALRRTLAAMNAHLLDAACVTLPLTTNALDADALLALPAVRERLGAALTSLARAELPVRPSRRG